MKTNCSRELLHYCIILILACYLFQTFLEFTHCSACHEHVVYTGIRLEGGGSEVQNLSGTDWGLKTIWKPVIQMSGLAPPPSVYATYAKFWFLYYSYYLIFIVRMQSEVSRPCLNHK